MADPITQALVQYDPSDITYFDNSVDAIRSGAALGRDLPPVSQYAIPPTLPVNPLSQLMTTGALLGNALPGFKEDISQGWDAIRDWMPETIELQDFLPDAIRKGVPRALEGLGNLIPSAEASETFAGMPRQPSQIEKALTSWFSPEYSQTEFDESTGMMERLNQPEPWIEDAPQLGSWNTFKQSEMLGLSDTDWRDHVNRIETLTAQSKAGEIPVYGEGGYHYLAAQDLAKRMTAAGRGSDLDMFQLGTLGLGAQLQREIGAKKAGEFEAGFGETRTYPEDVNPVAQALKDWASNVQGISSITTEPFTLSGVGGPVYEPQVDTFEDMPDPAKEAAATMGYMKPEEFGLDPFTNEQIAEARATFQRLMEETPEEVSQYISPTADPYIYQDQVAEALQKARAEQTLFTGDEVDVASRAPLNMANIMRAINRNAPSTGIGTDIVEPTVDPSPFIGDEGFTPSLPATTLGGPVVGTTQTGVPSGFEALASLIQDDPSVAQKYISGAGPTAELANLVANTGVETFTDIPDTPWTPPAPVVPDITEELVDFSAIQSSREAEAQKAQDKIDRQLEHAANVRRKDEEKARLASARNAKSEQARINKENKERKAEEKRIAASQAAAEKKRRATEKQMADMLKQMNETHQAYLARKREEEARRKRLGYGVGDMWT